METLKYDFIAIGSGPAGQRAAVQAAKEGRKTAIVDRRPRVGGVSLHTGTVPSKTLREAVLYFSEQRHKPIYGKSYRSERAVTLQNLITRVDKVLTHEMKVMDSQLRRNKIEVICGEASFEDARTLRIESLEGEPACYLTADSILIATGTQPRWPENIPIDQEVIFDSNFIFSARNLRNELPKSLVVVGGGVIGTEYACIFATLGCQVWVVDARQEILGFLDKEICALLLQSMKDDGIQFALGSEIAAISRTSEGRGRVELANSLAIEADTVLFAIGRTPAIAGLRLENTGIQLGKYGVIRVNEHFQTDEPNIYAAGDVIGYPALASTSAMQGQNAARHALKLPLRPPPQHLPFAIYTIPEIAMVGMTEEQLIEKKIPYEKGLAPYSEIGKAAIIGNTTGALKILFHRETRKILGAHILGDMGAELIHVALIAMSLDAQIEVFLENVFNSPTLSEIYKVAALHGINRLEGKTSLPSSLPAAQS